MRNLTLTIHFCDISQSFVSATKYENTSICHCIFRLYLVYRDFFILLNIAILHCMFSEIKNAAYIPN
jgi:hypothetical protein